MSYQSHKSNFFTANWLSISFRLSVVVVVVVACMLRLRLARASVLLRRSTLRRRLREERLSEVRRQGVVLSWRCKIYSPNVSSAGFPCQYFKSRFPQIYRCKDLGGKHFLCLAVTSQTVGPIFGHWLVYAVLALISPQNVLEISFLPKNSKTKRF